MTEYWLGAERVRWSYPDPDPEIGGGRDGVGEQYPFPEGKVHALDSHGRAPCGYRGQLTRLGDTPSWPGGMTGHCEECLALTR